MRSFKQFLSEEETKQYKAHYRKGSLHSIHDDDDGDHMYLYHGASEEHRDSIKKHGIVRPDPTTGMVSHAFDPNTAKAYAYTEEGQAKAGKRKKVSRLPDEKRDIHVMKVPKHLVRKALEDTNFAGNENKTVGLTPRQNLKNKKRFDQQKSDFMSNKRNATHPYASAEVRLTPEQSAEWHKKYYLGHIKMKKPADAN